jgi:predicted cytidylate kinase
MLRICISGFTCSGKTSIGSELAKELSILHITKGVTSTYKQLKSDHQTDKSSELKIRETSDKRYANAFDDEVMALSKANDCVVTTWIGPWIVKEPTVKVWLFASLDERAKRSALREGHSTKEAKEYIARKDKMNIEVFKDLYKIDILDHSDFDLMINTEKMGNKEIISLISMLAMGKESSRFR